MIARLDEGVGELGRRLPLARVILFGSYAAGRQSAGSDVDLLVVYRDPVIPDAYKIVWRTLGIRGLEPHVYAESEASAVADVLARMTRDGVQIYPPLTP